MNIKERIRNYFSKRKPISIAFDIVFYLLILLLLIPGTRKQIAPALIRTFLHPPISINVSERQPLTPEDYRWPVADEKGNPVFLSRYEGDVVFLNFWATWCPPCRAEMPSMQKLYNDYKDKIHFVFVTQEDPATVNAFMKEHGFTLPVYFQTYETPPLLTSRSIPTTFVLDKNGAIALKHMGASKWNSRKIRRMLDALLKE